MKQNLKQILGIGHLKENKRKVEDNCQHSIYCTGRKYSMKCIYSQDNCQLYKFYERYPNWEEIGIGSRI